MKLFNKIALTALIGSALFSCTKQDNLGPEIKTATSSFQFDESFTATSTSLHMLLTNTPVKFKANFNEEVSWTIRLEGQRSGAYWEKKGLSDVIAEEDAQWTGQSTSINHFLIGEDVGATLSILGHDSVYSVDSIEVVSINEFAQSPIEYRNGVKHVLIDDFDNNFSFVNNMVEGLAPDQNDVDVSFRVSEEVVLSGTQSYYMRGRDINDNSWSGGINSATLLEMYKGQDSTDLPVDSGVNPDELFFNIFIYGTGKPNTTIQMKVYELDAKVGTASEDVNSVMDVYRFASNDDNVYNQNVNDGYIFDIEVTWTGWKLVSVPYSDFRVSNSPTAGANGDRVKESFRIVGFGISLLSFPTSGQLTEAYIDRVTMTYGGRYQKRN